MQRTASGFYHDPPLWVGERPIQGLDVDFDRFDDVVFQQSLSEGLQIKVTREGLFRFDFTSWPPGHLPDSEEMGGAFSVLADAILNRTLVMNAWLALMYSHTLTEAHLGIDSMLVTPELVVSFLSFEDDSGGMGFGNQRVAHLCSSRFPSTYLPALPYSMDSRLMMRSGVIPLDVLQLTAQGLSQLVSSYGTEGLLLLDLFLRGSKAYQDHNHSSALISYWAITEKLLQEWWQDYQARNKVRDGQSFIDKKRADRLNDGRTFTAAVIAETLSLVGELELDIFQKLSAVRKARNDWIHNLKSNVAASDAVQAGEVCEALLKLVREIEVKGQRGLRLHS